MTPEKPLYEVKLVAVFDGSSLKIAHLTDVTTGPALAAIRAGKWAEVTIPYHTEEANYGFSVIIANKPQHEPAIREAMILQKMAAQLYADYGDRAELMGFQPQPEPGQTEPVEVYAEETKPLEGLDFCPYCGSDEIDVMFDPDPSPPFDTYRCADCGGSWDIGPEKFSPQTNLPDEAEALALLDRVFSQEYPPIKFESSAPRVFTLIGLLQLSARNLPPTHSLQPFLHEVVDHFTAALVSTTGEPELRRYIQLGWNPAFDVVTPNP